jgi:anthranilate/para-aminobenzoate synthase component II
MAISKKEQQKYQAQDDAYTMARYHEIMQDKARVARAVKVASEQAKGMQMQAKAMQAVAKTKTKTVKKK